MDQVDIAPVPRWSADGFMLESINTIGIFMYADFGNMEIVAYVGSLVHWFISSLVKSLILILWTGEQNKNNELINNKLMNQCTNEPMN